jgi:trehalose 6-phosphate synthase
LRVDRTDPSKNIVRGFTAYARMLERHPELHGRVGFLALLQPSRQDVPQYEQYLRRVHEIVAEVNQRFARGGWQPIDLRLQDDLPSAIAAYTLFDVLMVNPVFDGMNLVAKEAMLANESDGVLVLSENAGAHDELGAIALSVHPFDVEQQANALYDALMMAPSERRTRHEVGADIVRTNDLQKWLQRQLADIELMRGAPATR